MTELCTQSAQIIASLPQICYNAANRFLGYFHDSSQIQTKCVHAHRDHGGRSDPRHPRDTRRPKDHVASR